MTIKNVCIDCKREFSAFDYPIKVVINALEKKKEIKRCPMCFLKAFDLLFLECDLQDSLSANTKN